MLHALVAPYRGLPAAAWIQALASFVNRSAGAAKMFMPLYLRESLHVSVQSVGLMLAAYGGGLLIGANVFGWLSDRVSPRRVMLVAHSCNGLCVLAFAVPMPPLALAVLLALSGVFEGGARPVNLRLLLESCPPALRTRAHALHRVTVNLGWAAGGLIAGALATRDYRLVFIGDGVASILAAALLVVAFRRHPEPTVGAQTAKQRALEVASGSPWRDKAYLAQLAAVMAVGIAYDQMYGMFATFLREHEHIAPRLIGSLHALNGGLIVALQGILTLAVQRMGVWRASTLGTIGIAGSWLILLAFGGMGGAAATVAVLTMGEMLYSPSEISLVMLLSEGRARGSYLGLYSATWGGRTLLAPALGAAIFGAFGGNALWLTCAGLGGVSLGFRAIAKHYAGERARPAAAPTAI